MARLQSREIPERSFTMNQAFWDMLVNQASSGYLEKLSLPFQGQLRRLSAELAQILCASDSATRTEILSKLCAEVLGHIAELDAAAQPMNPSGSSAPPAAPTEKQEPDCGKIQPEILEWARQHMDEEATVAGLREIRETGGLELDDFLEEIEQEATRHE